MNATASKVNCDSNTLSQNSKLQAVLSAEDEQRIIDEQAQAEIARSKAWRDVELAKIGVARPAKAPRNTPEPEDQLEPPEPRPPLDPDAIRAGIDLEETKRFLKRLDSNATEFCFQIFDDRKPPGQRSDPLAKVRTGTLASLADWLIGKNAQGCGIFVAVNETDGKGRKNENIKRIRAVWRELDEEPTLSPSLTPSIIVESSPGKRHEYFLCDPEDPLTFDELDGAMRFMVEHMGSDISAQGRARVLRLPGFYHCKGAPVRTRLIGGDGWQFTREELLEAFPVLPAPKRNGAPITGDLEYTPANEALVRSIIDVIPPENFKSRDDWLRIGFAFARLGDSWRNEDNTDLRFEMWERLSGRAPGYENRETGCEANWEGILKDASARKSGPMATILTLLGMARKGGWTTVNAGIPPKLQLEALDSYYKITGAFDAIEKALAGLDPDLIVEYEAEAAESEAGRAEDESWNWREHKDFFKVLLLDEIEEHLNQVPPSVIKGFLDAVGTTCAYGDTQTWKTFGLIDMFDRIAAGEPWAGRETQQGLCVIFAAESITSVAKRALAVRSMRARGNDHPLAIVKEAPNLFTTRNGDAGDVKRIVRTVKKLAEHFGVPVRAIGIDTYAKATVGSDTNSDKDVGLIESRCDEVAHELQCQVILVHHTGKDVNHGARGSAAFRQNFPTVLEFALRKDREGNEIRVIVNEKQKDLERQPDVYLSIDSISIGRDSAGDIMNMGVVTARMSTGKEQTMTVDMRVLELISREEMRTQTAIAEAIGISVGKVNDVVQKLIAGSDIEKTNKVYKLTRKGRKRLSAAMGTEATDFDIPEPSEDFPMQTETVQ